MVRAKSSKNMAVKVLETAVSDAESSDIENNEEFNSEENTDENDEELGDGYDEGSDDDIEEILEDDKSNKRKFSQDDHETVPKKRKRNHPKNVKPPTTEEMLALRETENLFQSNLFRLQINEMLSELKPKKSIKRYIGPWIDNLKSRLMNLNESKSYDLSDMTWLKETKIRFPLRYKPTEIGKGTFLFKPPVDIFPIGSHSLTCPLGPFYTIDLAIVMPKTFIRHNDNLNQRYHIKRALYLCYIANNLNNSEDLSPDNKLKFSFMSDDPRKPLLVLYPSGKLNKFITVQLYPIPQENSFAFKRLLPSKNNARPEWWGLEKDILPPTPTYNASILEDVVLQKNHLLKKETFEKNQSLNDAFVLLRVWLKQRELNKGFGSFNSHLLSMLLIYLLKINKINKHMSSYQIVRNVWLYLGDSDWVENGPSLCEIKQEEAPTLEEFHIYYDIVFIDVTGFFNLAATLNKYVYFRVKEESKLAVQHLDNNQINGFRALFMIKMPFIREFDIVISFYDFPAMAKVIKSKGDEVNLMDYSNYMLPEFLRLLTELLEKGVGHRLTSIGVQLPSEGTWDIDTRIPAFSRLNVGLNLNVTTSLSLIDKGPQPNDPGADDFRDFWGNKCDLRRFKDGTVCESVVWEESVTSVEIRRTITSNIVLHLLKEKLQMHGLFNILSKSFQELVHPKKARLISREETCKKIILAYEDLSRQLSDLPDLPLSIVSVHCISPAYRFTEPFPPIKPLHYKDISPLCEDSVMGRLFADDGKLGKFSPEYIRPIDCVVQMAVTQKWPDDLNAGKRLIAAFNIAIAASLKKHCNLTCQITTDYFIVNKDGYLFRLFLGYSKEISLLKLQISDRGVKQYRDTPESLALEKKFINLPKVTGALYRLSEEYPGFSSATCLAKRWFSSLLLDETHFPGVLIEMLMAYLFINPQPFTPCLATLPAFLRFLSFISTTDWSITPIIVNFNSILTNDEVREIEDAFRSERSSFPPLFLATSYDKTGSVWSKSVPTISTLVRLTKLAAASLHIIETNIFDRSKADTILKVFLPPMTVYDAVIALHKPFQFRIEESMFHKDCSQNLEIHTTEKNPVLPILEFNPVDLYLKDLRENYNFLALFFHDPCGGLEIGVLFKPSFFEDIQFQTSAVNGKKPIQNNDKIILKPHLESIFEGFKILGNGIVKSIELHKLKDKFVNL